MRTLLLNPPSFENFDGGAGSRWPVTREVTSFWYPVWLAYPAAMIPESRLLDTGPHGIGWDETLRIARDFDFVAVFTSTPGFANDLRLAQALKDQRPDCRVAFVGPQVSVQPEETLRACPAIDFVVRREFDHALADFARGRPLADIPSVSYRRNGSVGHTPQAPELGTGDLDALPFVTPIYKRDLDHRRYNVPFLLHPYVSFYTERGCPALCTFCLWPQTFSGHGWRVRSPRSVAEEVELAYRLFPDLKEIFFDDDTFTYRRQRVLEVCGALKPLGRTWSCTARVTADYETLKAMREAGCRLLIVGFESGDEQILKNIKKGAGLAAARRFVRWCKELGLVIHGDFILGLPGETRETIEQSIRFACELDVETIQVSIAHAYPGTDLYEHLKSNQLFLGTDLVNAAGHQAVNFSYAGLPAGEIHAAVERFYKRYYFRPRVITRILRRALWDGAERRRLAREAWDFLRWLRSRRPAPA